MDYRLWRGSSRAAVVPHSDTPRIARLLGRAVLSFGLLLGFAWLLSDRMAQIDGAALVQAFADLRLDQWALGLGFTALSFWAVGHYDAVIHRHFATHVPQKMARRAGICAIAVSQTLGLGLISGAILRWRMLPGVSLWQATQLTAAVALSFLAGWAVVTACVLVILPDAPFQGWAVLALGLAGLLAAVSVAAPNLADVRFRWPNGFTLTRLILLCAVDSLAAALALHALLPEGLALPFTTLLPAFLLALGAGLALGTPGGMGAFEVTLLALLPMGENPDLLAAILAWRLVYYAIPAILGAGLAILGPAHIPQRACAVIPPLPADAPAESGLRHQGQLTLGLVAGQLWLLGRSGHCLIALLDPIAPCNTRSMDSALTAQDHLARSEGRLGIVYKASARLAARGRKMGRQIRRISWEAWLDPTSYRIASSSRSGLRRKLRRAEAVGVTVQHMPPHLAPWRALDDLAAEWCQTHGAERGFSMGRHERALLAQQRLYVAWQNGKPIAYASFHTAQTEWALDLMRHQRQMPDGTMHTLVQAAIEDAGKAGIPRLSLAAVPEAAFGHGDRITRGLVSLFPETAGKGLYQFKAAFAPRWRPLYLIAPGRLGLLLAALSLWRAISKPNPDMRRIERDDEEYAFASDPATWHIAGNSR